MAKLVVTVVVVSLAACSTFSGGDETADAGDGGGGNVDSSPPVEAGAGDAGASTCPDGAFCDGFERADYRTGWTEEGKLADASVRIDDTTGHSGTRSVRFDIPATTSEGRQYLARGLSTAARKVTVRYALRATPSVNLTFLTVEMGPAHVSYYDTISLAHGDQGARLQETINLAPDAGADSGTYMSESIVAPTPPEATFRVYTLTIDLDAKTSTLFDEESNLSTVKQLKFAHQPFRAVRLGIVYTASNVRPSNQTLWFDDVVIQ